MTAGRPRVPAPGRGRRSWAKLGAGRGPGLGAAVLPPGRGLAGRGGTGTAGAAFLQVFTSPAALRFS